MQCTVCQVRESGPGQQDKIPHIHIRIICQISGRPGQANNHIRVEHSAFARVYVCFVPFDYLVDYPLAIVLHI